MMADTLQRQGNCGAALALVILLLLVAYPLSVPPVILGVAQVHDALGMGGWGHNPLWLIAEAYAAPIGCFHHFAGESEFYLDYERWWIVRL